MDNDRILAKKKDVETAAEDGGDKAKESQSGTARGTTFLGGKHGSTRGSQSRTGMSSSHMSGTYSEDDDDDEGGNLPDTQSGDWGGRAHRRARCGCVADVDCYLQLGASSGKGCVV